MVSIIWNESNATINVLLYMPTVYMPSLCFYFAGVFHLKSENNNLLLPKHFNDPEMDESIIRTDAESFIVPPSGSCYGGFFFVRKHKFWIKLLFTIGQSTTMAIRRHNQYVPCSPRTFLHQSTKFQTETHQTRSVKLLRDTILYFTASPARRYIFPLLWLKDLKKTLLRCEPF